jgi:pimeloyl-ACP methyl ester carboxylesterase
MPARPSTTTIRRLALVRAVALALLLAVGGPAAAQQLISFPTEDGGLIYADLYGEGDRGVVLAHGGRFDKASWEKQARRLAKAGFRVLAIDFRGYGESRGPGDTDPLAAPLHLDVLAAVRYLRSTGAKTVSVVGASMGGAAAADASIRAPGEIDRLVLLAAWASGPPEKLTGAKLFIVARDDTRGDGVARLTRIREQYEKAPAPKELVVFDGSAHAQFLFESDQGERLTGEILRFLSAPAAEPHAPPLPALDTQFEPLRAAFNRDAGRVRLLLLLDPT